MKYEKNAENRLQMAIQIDFTKWKAFNFFSKLYFLS